MCSMVNFTKHYKKGEFQSETFEYILNDIGVILSSKGGDTFKFNVNIISEHHMFSEDFFVLDEEIITDHVVKISDLCQENFLVCINAFSRLTPEMESVGLLQHEYQPYVINAPHSRRAIMAHGTIPIIESDKFDHSKIDVDVEVFKKLTFDESKTYVRKAGGKVSLISMEASNRSMRIEFYQNGLGLYLYEFEDFDIVTNIDLNTMDNYAPFNQLNYIEVGKVTELDSGSLCFDFDKEFTVKLVKPQIDKRALALYTGGLDSFVNTFRALCKYTYKSIELVYVDWGTNASKDEIETVKNHCSFFNDYLSVEPHKVSVRILEAKKLFAGFFETINCITPRIADSDAKGKGQEEAEKALSYVPYRNTLLMTIIGAYIENNYKDKPEENEIQTDIIFGGNLTEGMVYNDNAITFIDSISKTLKYGGNNSNRFNVISPYATKTKTEMYGWLRKKINDDEINELKIFSCYFPKDGKECGECGSCLLRNAARERSKQ